MVPGLGSGQTAVLASTPDGLRGPVVDDGIKVNGQVSVGFVFVSGMPAPAIGQPIDSTGLEQPIAPIDVTAAAATGTLAVDLIDTGGIGGNAPLYLVTRDQATNQVVESRLLFPARATFASPTPLGTPLVVASATVPTTTPVADGTLYYHQDGLGTVTELTDINGAVAKAYAYDAYGNLLESPGTVEQPYTYTGREFDSESGLYYYRARYHISVLGRFVSEDPIGFRGGINLYAYVGNNPVNLIDPHGLSPECPDCVEKCLRDNYGDLADYALKASIFGLTSAAGLELAAYSAGAKFGVLGGIGVGAQLASQSLAQQGANILMSPVSNYSQYFGLQARAAAAESAFNLAERFGTASELAFKTARGLGIVGSIATVTGTSFYGTARVYCELQCRSK